MTDPHDTEGAVRRALAEVAASTPADPPPLDGTVVALVDPRQRRVLLAVAAVVAVVAGITGAVLLAGGADDEPESVETAEDVTTSTTDEPSTSTSASTSTSTSTTTDTSATTATTVPPSTSVPAATTTVPEPPRGELLASGEGWEVRLVGGCVVVFDAGGDAGRACDRDRDAWLLAAPIGDGRTVHVAGGRRVVTADGFFTDGTIAETFEVVADSGTGRYVVSDSLPAIVTLLEGPGSDWVAAIYGGRLVTDGPAFAGFSGYQRATGSLSMGRYQEIGGYYGNGTRCLVARQVNPEPAVVADFCAAGSDAVTALLVPTEHPELFDVFGLAMAVGGWTCELPDGGSCGGGDITGIAGFGGIISGAGPMNMGPTATEVVISVEGGGSVVVPVPRDA